MLSASSFMMFEARGLGWIPQWVILGTSAVCMRLSSNDKREAIALVFDGTIHFLLSYLSAFFRTSSLSDFKPQAPKNLLAAGNDSDMALSDSESTPQLPNEILEAIFVKHLLPSAATIGRERYETINVPRGPILKGPIKSYVDNDLGTGACTHRHGVWKVALQTLSALTLCNQRFRQLALPMLYKVYPGQTLVKPDTFLKALQAQPTRAGLVKEVVIDAWTRHLDAPQDSVLVPDWRYGITYDIVRSFQQHAKHWNDEAHAALILLHCPSLEALDLTVPSAYVDNSPLLGLFRQLLYRGPDTLARNNEEAKGRNGGPSSLPLRKVKALYLHHADNMYSRRMEYLGQLMRIPTVQSLTLYRFDGGAKPLANLRLLQHLSLWRCSLDSVDLLEGLKRCTELRSLTIIFVGYKLAFDRFLSATDTVDFFELGEVIRKHLKSLRKLRIDDRELQDQVPRLLGSLKTVNTLTDVAVNETSLGSYATKKKPVGKIETRVAQAQHLPLTALLPLGIQSLIIFRTNDWWHETERGLRAGEYISKGLAFRFHAVHDKIFDLLRDGRYETPELTVIRLDTPEAFGREVESLGWKCERVVGDAELERPSMTANSLVKPEAKQEWERAQLSRASKPGVVLRRVGRR